MAFRWYGYRALSQGRVLVDFEDITKLLHSFIVTPDTEIARLRTACDEGKAENVVIIRRVHGLGQWGSALQRIAESESTSEREKCKLVGQLCWRILSAMRFGEAAGQGNAPWENEHAAVWQDQGECPGLCKRGNAPADMRGEVCGAGDPKVYPAMVLGRQYCEELIGPAEARCYSAPVRLYLHRVACWLSTGNPGQQSRLATHGCGMRGCLRLGCLNWGNPRGNAEEYWQGLRDRKKRRKRR